MNLTEKIQNLQFEKEKLRGVEEELIDTITKALFSYFAKYDKILRIEDMALFYQNLNGKEFIHTHDDLGVITVYDKESLNNDFLLNLYKHSPILQEKLESELGAIIADV